MEWPILCARDEFVQATPGNAKSLDYIWVRGPTRGSLSKSLAKLPFQGSRFYHASPVRFMLKQDLITYADLGLGIRASGRLPSDVFRAPLDANEKVLPEEMRKSGINQWLGSLMIPPYEYKVFTAKDLHASVPFTGPRFTKEAPGGWDIFCRQRRVSLVSYRRLYQAVLDAELTLMAENCLPSATAINTKPRQLRVGGAVVQPPKKHAKRLVVWAEKDVGSWQALQGVAAGVRLPR